MAMTQAPVLHSVDERGVASVVLNRPEVGNAYDSEMVEGLLTAMDTLLARGRVRAVLLTGNERHFQAGADLAWVRFVSRASMSWRTPMPDRVTAEAFDRLNRLPVRRWPWCRAAVSGGTGIVAACDVVIAADNAMFSISEVRWG